MQRLFSTFAGGWPGVGLLTQRWTTAAVLLYCAVTTLGKTSQSGLVAPAVIGAAAGIFLLVGLWTPIAGTVIAVVEVWVTLLHVGSPFTSIVLAILGATLAMIGPGIWSIDARLFGRKYIDAP